MRATPIGQPVDRVDGRIKVTGAAVYAADNKPAGLTYGYIVTSTIGRGVITGMDTAAALASPGVLAVYTPFNPLKLFAYVQNQNDESAPPLQDKEVRFHGQTIGFVVAETWEQARDAASLIRTTYQQQPPVTAFPGPPAAMEKADTDAEGPDTVLATGVASVAQAVAAGEVTFTASYSTPVQHHCAMEPHATVATWNGDHLTAYTVTQGAVLSVRRLSETLGVDAAKIHVISPHVGGGFGGKWGNWAQVPLACAAAKALGRPVKAVLTREQVFTLAGHRPLTVQNLKMACTADGKLTAITNDGITSRGFAGSWSESVANWTLTTYASPSIQVTKTIVPLNLGAATVMRAPGEANGSFALESAMDELAERLGLDPLEMRMKNYATFVPNTGKPWSSKHLDECYRRGAEEFGWSKRPKKVRATVDGDWLVGTGMGTATYGASRGLASIKVRLSADGTASVSGTAADLGTGQYTVFAILAADVLGIPVDRVRPELGDSTSPTAANAGGSNSTCTNGPAVQVAAKAVQTELVALAVTNPKSPFHGKDPAEVVYRDGSVSSGGLTMSFGTLLTTCDVGSVEAVGTSPRLVDPEHGFRSFGVHFCEVRVHRWTGEPRVTRWLSVMDAGTIINVKAARSQIQGAVVMGIGQALLEATEVDQGTGRFANGNLASYLVPVHADIPPIDVRFLDHPDPLISGLGAKGIGELGIVGVAGAIGNAVHHATGVRVRELPITLEKLLGS
ncbi:xanthine dehydrogenase family protein molybdopterin-binding subunit [Lentzea tibetensis]|uniref:Xanthine dehydrogenase family protein molybdopterin-binding subunit n=1 Tax=Lentzea tibetensis TaxID=2591470 RepID=A0A563EKU4_9PSEU|nr:xanthine dehydrogenase family protein molybdopterin-binding subunit [Lentzea tibetensis]TWP47791.1 xanthine dehydrogenase family protein molybdopterin-binding subunit [Lentzea tibetensis]